MKAWVVKWRNALPFVGSVIVAFAVSEDVLLKAAPDAVDHVTESRAS